MATTAVIPHITEDTIQRIMAVIIPDITAATSTGGLTTAIDMFTRPDTPTTAGPVITAAGIAVGVAGKAEQPARGKKPRTATACHLSRM